MLVLIVLNAVFAGSEMALVSLRDSQIQRLERTSRGGRVLAKLARDPNRFLSTIQIGITLAGFLASAAAAVTLAKPLVEPLGFLGNAAPTVAIVVVTLVLTYFTLVLGELAPKRIAMRRAESWALLVARPLDIVAVLARPAVWLLGVSTDAVVRLFGVDPREQSEDVSPEEIRDLVATQRGFTRQQREIISGAFEITERLVREIIVPRRDVTTLAADTATDAGLRALVESGHSRAPVVGPGGLDDVTGIVHMRDLVDASGTVAEHCRDFMTLPESLRVSDALRHLRNAHQAFAVVVDEYGSVDGIITMEDLVEEIVGELYDETDRDVLDITREADGAMLLPGSFPLHDLPDLDIYIERPDDGDYTTIAGLLLAHLGRIPTEPGDIVDIDSHTAEITAIEQRAITQVRLRLKPEAADRDRDN
nr:hemolysin family protein [Stackebrandtia nassauensis]